MSKTLIALLFALTLAPACDDGDNKPSDGDSTGESSSSSSTGEPATDTDATSGPDGINGGSAGDDTDTDTDTDTEGSTGGEKEPGCALPLPPTGGPSGTIGDNC